MMRTASSSETPKSEDFADFNKMYDSALVLNKAAI